MKGLARGNSQNRPAGMGPPPGIEGLSISPENMFGPPTGNMIDPLTGNMLGPPTGNIIGPPT